MKERDEKALPGHEVAIKYPLCCIQPKPDQHGENSSARRRSSHVAETSFLLLAAAVPPRCSSSDCVVSRGSGAALRGAALSSCHSLVTTHVRSFHYPPKGWLRTTTIAQRQRRANMATIRAATREESVDPSHGGQHAGSTSIAGLGHAQAPIVAAADIGQRLRKSNGRGETEKNKAWRGQMVEGPHEYLADETSYRKDHPDRRLHRRTPNRRTAG